MEIALSFPIPKYIYIIIILYSWSLCGEETRVSIDETFN